MFLRNNAKRLNVKSASKVVKSGNPQKRMTKSQNILKSDSVKSASKVKTSKVQKILDCTVKDKVWEEKGKRLGVKSASKVVKSVKQTVVRQKCVKSCQKCIKSCQKCKTPY